MILQSEADILELIERDQWRMKALRTVATLALPDWWIGAGFVRNSVWDQLHGFTESTPLSDLDVIYFQAADRTNSKEESQIQQRLQELAPDYPWEVTNQATIHIFNQQKPYLNSVDALSRWTETATCIAVTMDASGELRLAAPYGIEDLLALKIRFTPHPEAKRAVFEDRIRTRNWFQKWPKLQVVEQR